jgi:phage terminase large subunit-like protein
MNDISLDLAHWRDPVKFIETGLHDPETGQPFVLTEAERLFIRHAFRLTSSGRLEYPELLFSAPKKSGKTALAAMLTIYVVVALGGRFAEAYCCANDLEQSTGRVFQAAARILEASPLFRDEVNITANRIVFVQSGSMITALANDYAGSAGANPTITVFDELWGYTSERAHRLWDEMVPPPTRKVACRLVVSYAGFYDESALLEGLYKRAIAGTEIAPDLYASAGLLAFWTHKFTAPWQTEAWREQVRASERPNAYLRLIENRWVSAETSFVDMQWWDECVDPELRPTLEDRALPVMVGVDASIKHDATAIVACTYDRDSKKVRLVAHKTFQPSPDDPLDFEHTIEATVLDFARRFRLKECRFDPYQMVSSAARLTARGINMVEFNQTAGNLTEASNNLYELVKGRNLAVYSDPDMRLAVSRAVAIETPRGWKISKSVASHKIDIVVALGMAALGAVGTASKKPPMAVHPDVLRRSAMIRNRPSLDYGYDRYGGGHDAFGELRGMQLRALARGR